MNIQLRLPHRVLAAQQAGETDIENRCIRWFHP